jgi:hypothetical protein
MPVSATVFREHRGGSTHSNTTSAVAAKQKGLREKAPVFIPGPDPFLTQSHQQR